MKKQLMIGTVLITLFLGSFLGCGDKCKDEPPSARILNNGTSKASVQIKTSNGNTVNINNVDPGTASPYASYAAGVVEFTITVSSVDYKETVAMANCFNYDIAIDASNKITTAAIDRNN